MITRLHHVAVACSDLSVAVDFYCDVFGLKVVRDSLYERDWSTILDWAKARSIRGVHLVDPGAREDGCRLSLVEWTAEIDPDVPNGYLVLSFECDVELVKQRLIARGGDVSHVTEKGGYIRGPDRLRIHISPRQFGMDPT